MCHGPPVLGHRDQEGEGTDAESMGGQPGATEAWENQEEKRQKNGTELARTWVGEKEETKKRGRRPSRDQDGKQGWVCKGRCKGAGTVMHRHHTGDARRTPWD